MQVQLNDYELIRIETALEVRINMLTETDKKAEMFKYDIIEYKEVLDKIKKARINKM